MVPLGIKGCVEAIYEPPQTCDGEGFDLAEDPNAEIVDAVAKRLGLKVRELSACVSCVG